MTSETGLDLATLEARIDKLTQALFHVASELWVAKDRQAVLERLLEQAGDGITDRIDSYRPEGELAETLECQREAFVAGILTYLAPED